MDNLDTKNLPDSSDKDREIEDLLEQTIASFEHFLPAQAPIKDFVHHNTLHGFQHLKFEKALAAASEINGANGFVEQSQFREFYKKGRINENDLDAVLADTDDLDEKQVLYSQHGVHISFGDIIKTILTQNFSPIPGSQFNWQSEELQILSSFNHQVSEDKKKQLVKLFQSQLVADQKINLLKNQETVSQELKLQELSQRAIADLWEACLEALNLQHLIVHPEEMLDFNLESSQVSEADHKKMQKYASKELVDLLDRVGDKITLSGLLVQLTGKNILDDIQPIIVRYVSSFLDLGFSPLHLDRSQGFYQSWRSSAKHDLSWVFDDLNNWHDMLESLPESSTEAVITELQQRGLKQKHWSSYLKRLVMEIPGWSGMFYWLYENPEYAQLQNIPVEMMDYLAVRLILERIFAQKLCNEQWLFDANLDMFRWYFRHKSSEFMVRDRFFNHQLPEYLSFEAQKLVALSHNNSVDYVQWQQLADLIWTWTQLPSNGQDHSHYGIYEHGWQLFNLAQYLGLSGSIIRALDAQQIKDIFTLFSQLDSEKMGFIWLQAYEINYRESILNMLANNKGRGNWSKRDSRPEVQAIFCMDDREEAYRRHMEEINPNIETFGAAAHYNVFVDFKGITDTDLSRLCPVVAIPAHEIHEKAAVNENINNRKLQYYSELRKKWVNKLHQYTRIGLLKSAFTIATSAPFAMAYLVGKTLLPQKTNDFLEKVKGDYEKSIATDVVTEAKQILDSPSPEHKQFGFSDNEQADRLETFLRNIGLIHTFSPIVVIFGHGSMSKNNPHLAAYDCGACSGRHSGPNARILAKFANRFNIREILSKRGINIPSDCLFIGAEHNTCDEIIVWFDLEKADQQFSQSITNFKQIIDQVNKLSAHERCRKLASAPKKPSLTQALKHIVERGVDFSQARPELGHATNACAFIGRRHLTQGAFLDRRGFLISYNPLEDPDGLIVERLILANGPVGAGISLEYYFSTVDNEHYGSGSKITHNVSGLFGVMDGTTSDLRTGLPRQMIEIHEAMRLQVIVESSTEMLTKIYTRQPAIQELVGNGWILLCSLDPITGEIFVFSPKRGFEPWLGEMTQLPVVNKSQDWYDGFDCHLPPALIQTSSAPLEG